MTQSLRYFCDICKKECLPIDGASNFTGVLAKLNAKMESASYKFSQDYCAECSETVLSFIGEFKKEYEKEPIKAKEDAKHNDTARMAK